MRKGIGVDVTAADRARREAVVANRNSPQKHVWRARIILLTAEGLGTNAIMRGTGRSKSVVWRWQERFMQEGVDGLLRDKTRPPGRRPLDVAVYRAGCRPDRPRSARRDDALDRRDDGQGGRHQRFLGAAELASARLQPHRVHRFKLSKDPNFVPKLREIVGLYVNPPAHAIVLSVDEKRHVRMAPDSQGKRAC
jgi:hypothetical protein